MESKLNTFHFALKSGASETHLISTPGFKHLFKIKLFNVKNAA